MPRKKKTVSKPPAKISVKSGEVWGRKILSYLQWKLGNYFFVAAFLLIFGALVFKFPSLGIRGEFWAESATNFFNNAVNVSFWHSLSATDTSYLPLLPRLISELLAGGLHLYRAFPMITGLISLAFVAFFASFITARPFRAIIPSDWARFLLALTLGFVANYENFTFNNFAYFGVYFLFLVIFLTKERLTKLELITTIVLGALLFTSKGFFLVFLPVYAYFLYEAWRKKSRPSVWFYGLTTLAGLVQLVVTAHNLNKWSIATTVHTTLWQKIGLTIFLFLRTVTTLVFGSNTDISGKLAFVTVIVILGLIGYLIYRLWRAQQSELSRFVGVSLILLVFSLGLSVLSLADVNTAAVSFRVYETLPLIRWYLFSFFFVLMIFVAVLSAAVKDQKVLVLILLIVGARFSLLGFASYQENFAETAFNSQVSFSQWQYFAPLLNDPDYCIPINPNPWVLTKNCSEFSNLGALATPSDSVGLGTLLPLKEIGTPTIRAIVLDRPPQPAGAQGLVIQAIKNGKVIGESQELTPLSNEWVYFLFNPKVVPDELRFFDNHGQPVAVGGGIHLYGAGTIESNVEVVSGANVPSAPLLAGQSAAQTFIAHSNDLSSIAVQLATYQRLNTDTLTLALREKGQSAVIASQTIHAADLSDNMYHLFSLDSPISNSAGRSYELTLTSEHGSAGNAISVWEGGNQLAGNRLRVNGADQPNLGLSYKLYYQ